MRLLKLVPDNTNIDFMRWRNVALILSILVTAAVDRPGLRPAASISASISSAARRCASPSASRRSLDDLRDRVDGARPRRGRASRNSARPNVISIRMPLPEGGEAAADAGREPGPRRDRRSTIPDARFDAVETVSGKVSEELFRSGAWAIALAMLGIAIYIWIRFEWQFGVGALVTLFHDVWMTLGFFSLTQLEFNLNVVAAVLTIVGYSLNDTVVIYDRIRENLRKYRKMEIVPLLNLSLNETLSRTMVTNLSILLALGALLILGPDVIFGLTIAIFIGIFVGTYSSIYISSPILVWLRVTSDSFLPKDPVSRAERTGEPQRRL